VCSRWPDPFWAEEWWITVVSWYAHLGKRCDPGLSWKRGYPCEW
jgi:hypothetical protein